MQQQSYGTVSQMILEKKKNFNQLINGIGGGGLQM